MSTNNKTVIGILGGVAAGALLGILFAPDKGSNTRKKIRVKSTAATDDLKGRLANITNSFSDKYGSLIKGGEFVEKQKEKVRMDNIKNINKELGS